MQNPKVENNISYHPETYQQHVCVWRPISSIKNVFKGGERYLESFITINFFRSSFVLDSESLTLKSHFHLLNLLLVLFFARPKSPWTPTTWSTGWRTSTHQATIRCWRGRRRSSAGPRRVRLGRWSRPPRALWSWSSWCPSVPWSPETLEEWDGWIPLTGSPPLLVYLLSEISFIDSLFYFPRLGLDKWAANQCRMALLTNCWKI